MPAARPSRRRTLVAAAAAIAAVVSAALPAVATPATHFHPGAPSLHDPLTPGYGNGGYDVQHYGIFLHYSATEEDMLDGRLAGRTVVTARLTQNLSSFNLDFVLPTTSVTVNGQPADFRLESEPEFAYGKELVVTPASGLPAGSTMRVVVRYAARPADVRVHGYSDWSPTVTGVTAWDEPTAATEWWFPGNAYPSDKATFDVTITADKAMQAITNGVLVSRRVDGAVATSHWRSRSPLSPHLAFLNIGRYDVVRQQVAGRPGYFAYEHTGTEFVARARRDVSQQPRIVAALQRWFGPYPFPVAGAIVSQTQYGTAFESQTRPTYTALYWKYHVRNVWAVVHELVHQWYGDAVGMSRWRHIWLAEGFATYGEWLWSGAHGHGSPEALFESTYQQYPKGDDFWTDPVVHPSFALESNAYDRGAMTLQALRNKVGSPTYFRILRSWARIRQFQAVPTLAFERLAERLSGQDLSAFFGVWLDSAHRPAPVPRNGFPHGFARRLAAGTIPVPPSAAAIQRTDRDLAGASATGR